MEMYENEELPATLEWYKDQIAGHHPSVVKNGIRQIGSKSSFFKFLFNASI
jgi:hypothetical protein